MTTKVYKHYGSKCILFFTQFADGWYHYTAQWYSEKYPWSGQWRRLARSGVFTNRTTGEMHVSSAGNEMKLELSSPLEFLVLTGRSFEESVRVEREWQEAITKI